MFKDSRHNLVTTSALASAFAAMLCLFAGVLDRSQPLTFGHDLLPSYTAGRVVREKLGGDLYNPQTHREIGRQIVADQNLTSDPQFVFFLNPGWFAAFFIPISIVPYRWAVLLWTSLNAGLFAGSVLVLMRWLGRSNRDALQLTSNALEKITLRGVSVESLPRQALCKKSLGCSRILLFILAILTSCPLLLAIEHQQNTFLSLALLIATISAWRGGHSFRAGLLAGLLTYKPQLAAVIALMLILSLGCRALAGFTLTGALLLLAGEWAAPHSTMGFLREVPTLVSQLHANPAFVWGRQITPTSFLRTLPGMSGPLATGLGALLSIAVVGTLSGCAWQARGGNPSARERLAAATVLALPLTAPYLMDYDLLLLAIPAAIAGRSVRSPTRLALYLALWLAIYLNVDSVRLFHINVALLAVAAIWLHTLFAKPAKDEISNEIEAPQLPACHTLLT